MKGRAWTMVAVGMGLVLLAPRAELGAQQQGDPLSPGAGAVVLVPTNHPMIPREISELWLAPETARGPRSATLDEFARAVQLEVDSDFAEALPIFSRRSLQDGPLGGYAVYYEGLAELRLGRPEDARRTFARLQAIPPVGYLVQAAALREAECDEALNDQAAAVQIYDRLAKTTTTAPDDTLMRLGRSAKAAGDLEKAANAFARVYYEFPLSDLSSLASDELDNLPNVQPISPGTSRYTLELGRAERLFNVKRYAQARAAFDGLRSVAASSDRERVNLRIAECDYFLKRPRNARDGVRPYTDHAVRQAEALFFYAVSTRDLGDEGEYQKTIQHLVAAFPASTWTEEALNNLATHDILDDDDAKADETFRQMYETFPTGRYAERAAWKIGWRSYKNGEYADAARTFEKAAATFPRSDYRPPWLYWAGRAHEALHEDALAGARFTLVATDYLNSYYGRLAVKQLDGRVPHVRSVVYTTAADRAASDDAPAPPPLPPNAHLIRGLLGLGLYDQASDELHYAQCVWGDSPAIQATLGWIAHARGDLRAGINAMKRAYPQYMAAGGEQLPPELLKVLFPVDYWPLIRRYAAERHLDPYLIAALIAQESTFTADVKSAANAYGLMQILPSTGRHYARALHLRRFSLGMLTTAETNIRMGTAYFADLVKQFGGAHFALASYNAGENRVSRWIAERPGVDREEFIDDIPFPETQNYVKKILGTAEDYRRLYGEGAARADGETDAAPAVAREAAPGSARTAVTRKLAAPSTKAMKRGARKASKKKPAHARSPVATKVVGQRKSAARKPAVKKGVVKKRASQSRRHKAHGATGARKSA